MIGLSSRRWNVFVLAGGMGLSAASGAQAAGEWRHTDAADMKFKHHFHTATELCNGKVLVVASLGLPRTAELYDPATETWRSIGPTKLDHPGFHTATLIPKGCGGVDRCQVLIAGGGFPEAVSNAEVYIEGATPDDPGTFEVRSGMAPRGTHTATPIEDGCKVMVAGGKFSSTDPIRKDSQIYNANADRARIPTPEPWWSALIPLRHRRFEHVAGALPGGGVVLAGGEGDGVVGQSKTAEMWDHVAGAWIDLPSMNQERIWPTACPLNDGRILVSGGRIGQTYHPEAEIFDPYTRTWTPTPNPMNHARWKFTCTTLVDGRVLVAGGSDPANQPDATAEIFDPINGSWTLWGELSVARYALASALLRQACPNPCRGCDVIVAGGYNAVESFVNVDRTTPPPRTSTPPPACTAP